MKAYVIPSIQVQPIAAVSVLCASSTPRTSSAIGIFGGDRSGSASGGY